MPDSIGQRIVRALVTLALQKNLKAIIYIIERLDGQPQTPEPSQLVDMSSESLCEWLETQGVRYKDNLNSDRLAAGLL